MMANQDKKEDKYNWDEVLRPNHLRFVFSSMAAALDVEASESMILGRSYPDAIVDIDLTPFQASDFGVSRQHAMIVPDGDGFSIKDLDSSNGTILNGEALDPAKSYPIHDGDMLFLGRMALTIRFLHDGARVSRRKKETKETSVVANKNNMTRMLVDPRESTRTVEMRGLLKLLDDLDDKAKK